MHEYESHWSVKNVSSNYDEEVGSSFMYRPPEIFWEAKKKAEEAAEEEKQDEKMFCTNDGQNGKFRQNSKIFHYEKLNKLYFNRIFFKYILREAALPVGCTNASKGQTKEDPRKRKTKINC